MTQLDLFAHICNVEHDTVRGLVQADGWGGTWLVGADHCIGLVVVADERPVAGKPHEWRTAVAPTDLVRPTAGHAVLPPTLRDLLDEGALDTPERIVRRCYGGLLAPWREACDLDGLRVAVRAYRRALRRHLPAVNRQLVAAGLHTVSRWERRERELDLIARAMATLPGLPCSRRLS